MRQQALGAQQQFAYQQDQADNGQSQDGASYSQSEPQSIKYQQQQAIPNRIQFSPSNEVSHVKFSSDDSNYNF